MEDYFAGSVAGEPYQVLSPPPPGYFCEACGLAFRLFDFYELTPGGNFVHQLGQDVPPVRSCGVRFNAQGEPLYRVRLDPSETDS